MPFIFTSIKSIININSIDVKIYGIDKNDTNKEIDDGRLSISLSVSSSLYENLYFGHTKKARKKLEKNLWKMTSCTI